jgi:hypothetical protein
MIDDKMLEIAVGWSDNAAQNSRIFESIDVDEALGFENFSFEMAHPNLPITEGLSDQLLPFVFLFLLLRGYYLLSRCCSDLKFLPGSLLDHMVRQVVLGLVKRRNWIVRVFQVLLEFDVILPEAY